MAIATEIGRYVSESRQRRSGQRLVGVLKADDGDGDDFWHQGTGRD
jgi:hypothetical protein